MPSRHLLLLPVIATLAAVSGCRDTKIESYRVPKETPPPAAANASAPTAPSTDPHAGLGIPPANTNTNAPAAPMPSSDMASTAVPTAAGGDLTWTAPAHWESRPVSSMRKATFIISGNAGEQAELAVTAFPGDVGGNLANVNRWRSQIQLPPIAAAGLSSALDHLHAGDLHIDVADILGPVPADGKPRQRILGGIVPFNGATWFFKLTGPDALVAREKDAFYAFIKTLQPVR